ncbi:MAG: putative toxin-antitoxin system toxin component, PIN family [Acidobacteria bacterium]|nr:MAG: putative toxin-antitoxin system toxin component, PIN family [Acidobacteriota bacterium]
MRRRERIVVDTNCLVSRLLLADSIPGLAVRKAVDASILLVSEATMEELADVLGRSKFDRYVSIEDRKQFLRLLGRVAEFVPIIYPVHECRDPDDDRFLEVALNGRASVILSGDQDLLSLHPWRNVAILSPKEYLKR